MATRTPSTSGDGGELILIGPFSPHLASGDKGWRQVFTPSTKGSDTTKDARKLRPSLRAGRAGVVVECVT